MGKWKNCNLNPPEMVPDNTVLQQLTPVPTGVQNRLVALQFDGSTEVMRAAGFQILQVPAQHW